QLAAGDDIDWFFLLAMAAARTEIVRFDEVWWRLRLVSARLTQRVNDMGRAGVLERLWLVGHLGRAIYGRPGGNDRAACLEFFHANLRDYLLRDVMGTGTTEIGIRGRTAGTPAAWRALDRLAAAAHDWFQIQQVLPADDLAILMQHRDVVVETSRADGEDKH